MPNFPASIFAPRQLANKTGKPYNATQTKILYAEDINKATDEIVAIETALGLNPKGSAESVAARFSADEAAISGKQAALGYTPENVANKDTDITLAANSDSRYASQKAVKSYIDGNLAYRDYVIYLTSNQTYYNNSGYNQVANFTLNLPVGKLIMYEFCLLVSSTALAGFYYYIYSNSASYNYFKESQDAGNASARLVNTNQTVTFGGTQYQVIRISGVCQSSSGFTSALYCGQQNARSENTILKAGSWMRFKVLN
jgi:hypothetical protein